MRKGQMSDKANWFVKKPSMEVLNKLLTLVEHQLKDNDLVNKKYYSQDMLTKKISKQPFSPEKNKK